MTFLLFPSARLYEGGRGAQRCVSTADVHAPPFQQICGSARTAICPGLRSGTGCPLAAHELVVRLSAELAPQAVPPPKGGPPQNVPVMFVLRARLCGLPAVAPA